jgi:uncharacterized DUF497 family protein
MSGSNDSAMQLDIKWDPVKAHSNITKHNGVTFAQAASVLLDALALTVSDAAHLPAHRADQCGSAHHFSARSHETRTPAV